MGHSTLLWGAVLCSAVQCCARLLLYCTAVVLVVTGGVRMNRTSFSATLERAWLTLIVCIIFCTNDQPVTALSSPLMRVGPEEVYRLCVKTFIAEMRRSRQSQVVFTMERHSKLRKGVITWNDVHEVPWVCRFARQRYIARCFRSRNHDNVPELQEASTKKVSKHT